VPISAAAVPAAATVQFELCASLSNVAASVPTAIIAAGFCRSVSNDVVLVHVAQLVCVRLHVTYAAAATTTAPSEPAASREPTSWKQQYAKSTIAVASYRPQFRSERPADDVGPERDCPGSKENGAMSANAQFAAEKQLEEQLPASQFAQQQFSATATVPATVSAAAAADAPAASAAKFECPTSPVESSKTRSTPAATRIPRARSSQKAAAAKEIRSVEIRPFRAP